jgi:hypothetical protein
VLIKLKIAVLAPMPSASERTATAVKPGVRRSVRAAYRTSCHVVSTTVRQPMRCVTNSMAAGYPPSLVCQDEGACTAMTNGN